MKREPLPVCQEGFSILSFPRSVASSINVTSPSCISGLVCLRFLVLEELTSSLDSPVLTNVRPWGTKRTAIRHTVLDRVKRGTFFFRFPSLPFHFWDPAGLQWNLMSLALHDAVHREADDVQEKRHGCRHRKQEERLNPPKSETKNNMLRVPSGETRQWRSPGI